MRNRILIIMLFLSSQLHADPMWKRATMLRNDLAQALALPPNQLCLELGTYSCTDLVHNFSLGGRDPFDRAQYTSMEKPSQLTATAFERTVLQSCIQRIKKDGSDPKVFRFYALNKTLNDTSDELIKLQIQDLYQRFFQRPAAGTEVTTALKLADRNRFGSTSMDQWSQALCLAVGSQWTNLFF
ncbi:MAG TPA: hypothetical protein VE954_41440 [Oligoflexus sp.]|uniref:hypothetical protein n=1 Tax=Oligoflexus sp. TaxID=1971216 RepID=UPI002D49A740|nr:hypothetical protein [Oligoflexus sp.]HYX39606.1 hypothetical protein [Oligoflexus sp.]